MVTNKEKFEIVNVEIIDNEFDYEKIYGRNTDLNNSNTYFGTHQLFNGNISSWESNSCNLPALAGHRFEYDVLNRLKCSNYMTANYVSPPDPISWQDADLSRLNTIYSYDPNGNMVNLVRNHNMQNTDGTTAMDILTYTYGTISSKKSNRLNYINDANTYTFTIDPGDIKNGQAVDNYVYDASGNLTKDVQENINNIVWTADGKVDKICKDGCPKPDTIYFYYDARGDRIAKIDVFYNEDACSGTNRVATITKTFYVRDASGEILAIYKKIHLNRICTVSGSTCTCTTNDDELSGTNDIPLTEWLVYGLKGHGRFATVKPTHDTYNTFKTPVTSFARTMKFKEYELKDHLGNVRATFNDLKYIVNGEFSLNNLETFNYYPFGMLEPTTQSYDGYRFGYNGMERDDEVKDKRIPPYGNRSGSGKGNSYDYGARFYDPRGARWFSRDPFEQKYVGLSPYHYALNNPIYFLDPNGKFTIPNHWKAYNETGTMNPLFGAIDGLFNDVAKMKDEKTHFDNCVNRQEVMKIVDEAGGWNKLGKHQGGDFFSHSNYVDIWDNLLQNGEVSGVIPLPDEVEKGSVFDNALNDKNNGLRTTNYPDKEDKDTYGHDNGYNQLSKNPNAFGAKDQLIEKGENKEIRNRRFEMAFDLYKRWLIKNKNNSSGE